MTGDAFSRTTYAGGDRRRPAQEIAAGVTGRGHEFEVAICGLFTVTVLAAIAGTIGGDVVADASNLPTLLTGAAVVAAIFTSLLCLVRWRLMGSAVAGRFATAILVYATLHVGADVVRFLLPDPSAGSVALTALRPVVAGGLTVAFVGALRSPEVDAGVHPARLLLRLLSAICAATIGLLLLPAPMMLTALWLVPAAGVAWMVLGARELARGHDPIVAGPREWMALLVMGLGAGQILGFALSAAASTASRDAASSLVTLATLLFTLVGMGGTVQRSFGAQSRTLQDAESSAAAAEARILAAYASQEERAHEARNALAAIEGATFVLQRQRPLMDAASAEALTAAVTAEIHRLQQLITPVAAPRELGRFHLSQSIAAVVTCARSLGVRIDVNVPDHLVAIGHAADTAQVVQNLLENVRRHGGGRVTLSARRVGTTVELHVSDRGPGVPVAEHEHIFNRGFRGAAAQPGTGNGLGLHVARELVQEQQGSLRVEDRPGGGANFILMLQGFSTATAIPRLTASADDGVEHRIDVGQAPTGLRLVAPLTGQQQRGSLRGDQDDPPGQHVAR